jgi:hypothetical protein
MQLVHEALEARKAMAMEQQQHPQEQEQEQDLPTTLQARAAAIASAVADAGPKVCAAYPMYMYIHDSFSISFGSPFSSILVYFLYFYTKPAVDVLPMNTSHLFVYHNMIFDTFPVCD